MRKNNNKIIKNGPRNIREKYSYISLRRPSHFIPSKVMEILAEGKTGTAFSVEYDHYLTIPGIKAKLQARAYDQIM